LADRLRVGEAPRIPHLFRPDAVTGTDLAGGSDGKTALFISHAHLDHIGLTGFVDPAIPMYASEETIRLMDALHQAGEDVEGGVPHLMPLAEGQPLNFGPFTIRRYGVDHDVIGASGYAVTTPDGVLAFTGDIRLHGRHPEKSLNFADQVRGARALVIEGTTLSFGFTHSERTEFDVDQQFGRIVAETPGLVLLTLYPRNVERVEAFLAKAREHGRTLVWPPTMARLFRALGLSGIVAFGEDVALADILAEPGRFVLNLSSDALPLLLDLPLGPGSVFIHANGEPLGAFDPRFELLQDWLKFRHTPFWPIGTGGHASPDDLNRLVERIHPDILFPLHSQAPDRLIPPPGTLRWLPQRGGRRFNLAGRETT
jgi:ribonuclease J